MKFGWVIGIVIAVLLHAGFLLFGGLIVGTDKDKKTKPVEVEVLSDSAALEKEKEKEKPPEEKKPEDEMETPPEEIPDAEEVVRNMELSAAAAAPELEAASLAAIESALNGGGAGGSDVGEAVNFASGGRIGGTAKAGSLEQKMENAFNLAEIDQKPRATFQGPPTYPTEMRGKKVEGLVSVIFVVDPGGKVTNAKVEKSSNPGFERAALEAVRQWRFEPGLKGGERVSCKMRAPIRFQKS